MAQWTPPASQAGHLHPLSPRVLNQAANKDRFGWRFKFRSDEQQELEILSENLGLLEGGGPHTRQELGEEDISIQEGETQEHLDPGSLSDSGLTELIDGLVSWVNQELAAHRVQLTDIKTDLRDGQVLALMHEKIMGCPRVQLPCGEYVQSRERQRRNLDFIIEEINRSLKLTDDQIKWNTSLLFTGEILNTLRLLVKINQYCISNSRTAPELPRVLKVKILRIKQVGGGLQCEKRSINIIGEDPLIGMRDGFDTLIDHAPQKLHFVQNTLIQFANSHLTPLGYGVEKLDQFADGVRLCLLVATLQGFFIPLYEYTQSPVTKEDKIGNVELAFRFMQEAGLPSPINRPGEVVRGDLKSILRIIYALFVKYKHSYL